MSDAATERSPEAFVDRHLRSVWRYLRMHGASAAVADDLAQEALLTALQKGALRLDPPAARVFLRRTARFAWLHHRRGLRRDPLASAAVADAVDHLWDRDAVDDDGDALVAAVRSCVDRLDGRAGDAVRRAYGIGAEGGGPGTAEPRDQLARSLGLAPNGLKTLLQRARQLLRTCLERAQR